MKHASTTSMMVRMTLSDLPSTDPGVHKRHTISTIVEIGLLVLKDACTTSTTVRMTLYDLSSTDTRVHNYHTTSTVM